MKWLIYLLLLAGAAILPGEATDVGKLIPVEVIAVSEDAGTIYIETDTGDKGKGSTFAKAISDMENSASGVIYLDTAEYLILEEGLEPIADSLRRYLKDDVKLCCGAQGIRLEGIAEYLTIHKPEVRLCEVGNGTEIQVIREDNGRFILGEK